MNPSPPTDDTARRTRTVIDRWNDAFNRHDVAALESLMADDCVFEDTSPPDGRRHEGRAAVAECWHELFASSPTATFDAEEVVVAEDRAVVRWRYHWTHDGGGHVRGVDVFRVRAGQVAEKYSYVKG